MRILRHRSTRHFVAVLISCRCGRRFVHRLDRPLVACLVCGRIANLVDLLEPLRGERRAHRHASPRAARRSQGRKGALTGKR